MRNHNQRHFGSHRYTQPEVRGHVWLRIATNAVLHKTRCLPKNYYEIFFSVTFSLSSGNVNFIDDRVKKCTYLLGVADSPWPTYNTSTTAVGGVEPEATNKLGTRLAHECEPGSHA